METNLNKLSVPETKISSFLDLQVYLDKFMGQGSEEENGGLKDCVDGSKVFFSPLHEDTSKVKGLVFERGVLREIEVSYKVPVCVNGGVGGRLHLQEWETKFIKYRIDSAVYENERIIHAVITLTGDRVEGVLPVGETLH